MVDAIDEVSGRQVRRVSVDYGSGGDNTGEHPPGSVSPGGTPMVPQVSGAAATVESLRTADMKYDDNSAVEYAMSKANKRLSVTRLKATGGLPHTHKDKNDIPHKPKSKRKEKAKNAEGRLITQGHEQYALTYGMMLGIRVSVSETVSLIDSCWKLCILFCIYLYLLHVTDW